MGCQPARARYAAPLTLPRTLPCAPAAQVMDVPVGWRPRPMLRAYGLPQATGEDELADLLEEQLAGLGFPPVLSVVFDPRQATAGGKVALVRFEPLPPPAALAGDAAAAAADAGKVAGDIIAALRAKAPSLHGAKVNVEKTGAEVMMRGCWC